MMLSTAQFKNDF